MKIVQMLSFLLLLSLQSPLLAQNTHLGAYNILETMNENKVRAVSIAIYKEHELDTLIQFGTRDEAEKIAVDEHTLFQAGSMTGAVTNFAILRAVQDGKIALDKPTNDYLNSWKIPTKKYTAERPVTIRDLMLQRRGFNGGSKPKGYIPGETIPTLQQILEGKSPANSSAVRLKKDKNTSGNSAYNNAVILQQVLEEIYEIPFYKIIQELVFDPIGMKDSYMVAELTAEAKQNAAVGYTKKGELIEGLRWIHPELGSTGLWTTPKDYAAFTNHVIQAAAGMNNNILTKSFAEGGLNPIGDEYRALIFLKNKNRTYWGGASMGFRTQMTAIAEEGLVYVVFMNSHQNWEYMNEVSGKVSAFAKGTLK